MAILTASETDSVTVFIPSPSAIATTSPSSEYTFLWLVALVFIVIIICVPIGIYHTHYQKRRPITLAHLDRSDYYRDYSSENLYQNETLETENKEEEVVDSKPLETENNEEEDVGSIFLKGIMGYLVHKDNCSIHRCPCIMIKRRFQHLMPEAHHRMALCDQKSHSRTCQASALEFNAGLSPQHESRQGAVTFEQRTKVGSKHSHTHQSCKESSSASQSVKCGLPEGTTQTSTLFRCSSKGVRYVDEANDFSLEIPDGAIPEGKTLTIDVGVALHGPFQFPDGLRPVSPMFWVCVRDQPNFHFSKPVRVTIPHFLNLKTESDIQSLGLTFLKASHNPNSQQMYQFLPTDGDMNFEPLNRFGVLETTHFCSLCIVCRDMPECLERTTFCINAVLPDSAIPVGKRVHGYFFITFLLHYTTLPLFCLSKLCGSMGLHCVLIACVWGGADPL